MLKTIEISHRGIGSDLAEPYVTFLLFTYQQEASVEAAVRGAFSQTFSPLEIILSDDASTDGTFDIMCELVRNYAGPHKVRVRRSMNNRGVADHVHEAVLEAKGELIIMAAGDDVSLPTRTERLVEQWRKLGSPTAVIYSDFEPMGRDGKKTELRDEKVYPGPFPLAILASGERSPFGGTSAVTRDVITELQPISSLVRYEDRVFGFRALLTGGVISFIDEKLVRYQIYGGISRLAAVDRIDYVTKYARRDNLLRLADARQRLRDAIFLQSDNRLLIRACTATVNGHRARVAMSNGSALIRKGLYFTRRGADVAPLFQHFVKCVIARVILWLRR